MGDWIGKVSCCWHLSPPTSSCHQVSSGYFNVGMCKASRRLLHGYLRLRCAGPIPGFIDTFILSNINRKASRVYSKARQKEGATVRITRLPL